jgi:hypothetical protein
MTQDEIIEMARQAGFGNYTFEALSMFEVFAKLVAEHEREKYKWDIHSCSPTCNRYVCVAKREAVLAEREECAKLCEKWTPTDADGVCDVADAIRERGQA